MAITFLLHLIDLNVRDKGSVADHDANDAGTHRRLLPAAHICGGQAESVAGLLYRRRI